MEQAMIRSNKNLSKANIQQWLVTVSVTVVINSYLFMKHQMVFYISEVQFKLKSMNGTPLFQIFEVPNSQHFVKPESIRTSMRINSHDV